MSSPLPSRPLRRALVPLLGLFLLLGAAGAASAQADDAEQVRTQAKAQIRIQEKSVQQIRLRIQSPERPVPDASLSGDRVRDRLGDGDGDGVPDRLRQRLRDCLEDAALLSSWMRWAVGLP